MKSLLIVFTIISLAVYTAALCPVGCTCSDDSSCQYYCNTGLCQSQIPPWGRCSGHYIHPRECGSVSYCDPSTLTCQLQIGNGQWCTYDFSCLSGYCDYSTRTCRNKYINADWQLFILVPILIVVIFLTLLFVVIIIVRNRQRQRAFTHCPNQYVVLPPHAPCSYQNACMVGEMPPPHYPGPTFTPSQKPYQG